ncbi:MAG TPA: GAF domain-containing protein [Variovorax sp.]|nr:GAF domain-containing protein [Variovorax sp.]
MVLADGFVAQHYLQPSIDASRAMAMQIRTLEMDDGGQEQDFALRPLADQAMAGLLRVLEEDLGIDAVFVADQAQEGSAPPRRAARKPAGAGIGTPIRLASGRIFGMLCFFRREPEGQLDERDVRRLEMSARLAARLIDGADAHGIA